MRNTRASDAHFALTRILAEDEEIVDSRLDLLLKFQNEPQKHEASFHETIRSLDRMLEAVPVEDPRFTWGFSKYMEPRRPHNRLSLK